MPSPDWLIKNYHHRWYPDETLDIAIGQGAIEATPIQLARIISGIASGGHLVRPHVVSPDQLPDDFKKALKDSFPGTGEAYVPIDPQNWTIITDGMAEVTQPGLYHTAGGEHLEGIDFAGKTGTAQVMSHAALDKGSKGRATDPNVWFVGVVPRRNPELVVAVLWQNGNKSWFPARIGAQFVSAYVNKKRREANNLPPEKAAAPAKPVEVGAVWTAPNGKPDANGSETAKLQGGHFFVDGHGNVIQNQTRSVATDPAAKNRGSLPAAKRDTAGVTPTSANPRAAQVAAALPAQPKEP